VKLVENGKMREIEEDVLLGHEEKKNILLSLN
jgi:hypothetical protein